MCVYVREREGEGESQTDRRLRDRQAQRWTDKPIGRQIDRGQTDKQINR